MASPRLPTFVALCASFGSFVLLAINAYLGPLEVAALSAIGAILVAIAYRALVKASGMILFLSTTLTALLTTIALMLLDELLNLSVISTDLFEVESLLGLLAFSPLAGLLAVAVRSLVRELGR